MEKLLPLKEMSEKFKQIGIYKQEYGSSLKIDFLLVSIIVSTSRKKLGIK